MLPFTQIIAATDLSECAGHAFDYANAIRDKFDAELSLLHALMPGPRYGSMSSALAVAETPPDQFESGRRALQHVHGPQLESLPRVNQLVVAGSPSDAILANAAALRADLVVVGTRGRTGIERGFLGSVAEGLIRASDYPVLAVPCKPPAAGQLFRRIMVTVDYTRSSREVLRRAEGLASAFQSELVVLYGAHAADVADRDVELSHLREWIGDVPVPFTPKIVLHRGSAAEQILWRARHEEADLLVVARGKRTAANALNATTKTMIRFSHCPVLTIPVVTE